MTSCEAALSLRSVFAWLSGEAPFAQIPMFVTGDPSVGTLVQMNAILRYLGTKTGTFQDSRVVAHVPPDDVAVYRPQVRQVWS
jgi:glutathione S-transferase